MQNTQIMLFSLEAINGLEEVGMGKYDNTKDTLLSYEKVGLTQLEDAISLFLDDRYLSAITLAGASAEIFKNIKEKVRGEKSIEDETWEAIEEARKHTNLKVAVNPETGDEYTKSGQNGAFNFWNKTRNKLKHYDPKKDGTALEINLVDESYDWLQRAIASASSIGLEPKNLFEFQNNTIQRFHM